MPVDLQSRTLVQTTSLVLEDDSLAMLESDGNSDRVRRVLFEGVENVQVWRVAPLGRIIVSVLVFGLPAVGLLFVNEMPVYIFSAVLFLVGACVVAYFVFCGKTTIQIVNRGEVQKFVVVDRPKKIERFLTRLQDGINKTQARAHAAVALAQPQQPPPIPPASETEVVTSVDELPSAQAPGAQVTFPPPPPPDAGSTSAS